jgi:hypothetical protein
MKRHPPGEDVEVDVGEGDGATGEAADTIDDHATQDEGQDDEHDHQPAEGDNTDHQRPAVKPAHASRL